MWLSSDGLDWLQFWRLLVQRSPGRTLLLPRLPERDIEDRSSIGSNNTIDLCQQRLQQLSVNNNSTDLVIMARATMTQFSVQPMETQELMLEAIAR